MAKKGKQIDWDAVAKEYMAGQLSVREISRRYNCSEGGIRRRAEKGNWTRDLTEEVRKRVRSNLAREDARKNYAEVTNDEQVIEIATKRGTEIELLQRADINKLRDLETDLIERLERDEKIAIVYKGEITGELPMAPPARADCLRSLTWVRHKRIELERNAYKLDDDKIDLERILAGLPKQFGDRVRAALTRLVSGTEKAGCEE